MLRVHGQPFAALFDVQRGKPQADSVGSSQASAFHGSFKLKTRVLDKLLRRLCRKLRGGQAVGW